MQRSRENVKRAEEKNHRENLEDCFKVAEMCEARREVATEREMSRKSLSGVCPWLRPSVRKKSWSMSPRCLILEVSRGVETFSQLLRMLLMLLVKGYMVISSDRFIELKTICSQLLYWYHKLNFSRSRTSTARLVPFAEYLSNQQLYNRMYDGRRIKRERAISSAWSRTGDRSRTGEKKS